MPNLCSKFTCPKPIAWFFFILCFGTCMAFGTWQVERLHWKQGLIASLAAANAAAPLTTLPSDPVDLKPLQFRKVRVHGTWLGSTEFHVTPRYLNNQFGYAIITPLALPDRRIILINRGWVPAAKKLAESRPETHVSGQATVTGLLRVDRDRSYFTPANQPSKNIWFARDIDEMTEDGHLANVIPAMIDATDPNAPTQTNAATTPSTSVIGGEHTQNQKLPIPSDGTIRLRNDHLSYIVTWYGIALGILIIFVTYHRKKD